MKVALQRMFRVLPDEAGKLFAFIALAAFLQAGLSIGIASADAIFLANLGAGNLPYVYLLLPVVTLAYAPLYSILLTRLGINKLFVLTLCILVAGGIAFGAAFTMLDKPPDSLIYGVKVYTGLWFIAVYTLFWNFADDYFAILDGKRLFGLIAAGYSLGGMVGAGIVSGLAPVMNTGYFFYIWSGVALLTLPVFLATSRHSKVEFGFTEEEAQSSWDILKTVVQAFRTSRFALCLALICFTLVNLGALLEFLSFGVFEEGRNTAELAALLGKLYAIAAGLTLFINLFLFSRVVGRLGVNNTALIVPFGFLGAFIFFYLDYGMMAALVGFYVIHTLFVSIEYNNINLLFNGLASGVRKHLRTFIEALGEPLATAAAGAFLLLYANQFGTDGVAFVGLLIGGVAVVIALFIRSDFVYSLATNLRQDWLDLSSAGFREASRLSPAEHQLLFHQALHGQPPERLLAIELLWRLGDSRARKALVQYLEIARADDMERLSPIISGLLTNSDNAILAEILLWLETRSADCPAEIMGEFLSVGAIPTRQLAGWKDSQDPDKMALLAVARWHNPRIDETSQALAQVKCMLAQPGPARHWALRALGDFRHSAQAGELLPWISDPDAETRLQALRAFAKLSSGLDDLPPAIIDRITCADPRELRLLLTIVAGVSDTSAVIPILKIAAGLPGQESRHVEAAIIGMGSKATPSVVRILRDRELSYRTRVLAARILDRIALPQLQSMADSLIEAELSSHNRDNPASQLDFILELLSLTGRLPHLDLIRTSLAHSNARDWANAVETIEQYVGRRIFVRLQPLINAPLRASLNP